MRLGGADTGAGVRELRKARITDLGFDQGDEAIRILLVLAAGDREIVHDRQPGRGEGAFHVDLVEAQRRAQHAGTYVRDVGKLEHPLDGPILAVQPVKHGKDGVERRQRRAAADAILCRHERSLRWVGRQVDVLASGGVAEPLQRATDQPPTGLVDVEGHGLEAIRVHGRNDRLRRQDGDLVLG